MGLSSPGVGSGLDVKAIVDAYVKAEITPAQSRHDKKLTFVNTELSAIGQLKSALSSLQTSLTKLSDLSQFYTMKYSSSDTDALSANITSEALKGTYQIEIQKLAQQQSLASAYIPDVANVGSGAITINFGTYNGDKTTFTTNASVPPVTINIAPSSSNLISIRDAINKSSAGVTASIVQDNQGSRLTLTSPQTGENVAMKISGDIAALNYDPTTGVNAMTETVAAQNSLVKVNGLILNQSSNQLKDAISGVTLSLKQAQLGKNVTLTIDDNKDQVSLLLNDFIKQYNDSMTFLTNLTGYNAETKQGGMFQGDPQFRNLKLNLNKWATTPLTNNNTVIKTLADLGITTNRQGLLEINKDIYAKALADNYKEIGTLFAKTATSTDANIRVSKIDSRIKAGSYDVVLNSYIPGVSMSGTIGGIAASSSDGITLNGSGSLTGLSLNVLSGSSGARGKIVVNDGLGAVLNGFLDTYMSTNGDLNLRTNQLNLEIKQLSAQQSNIDLRSENIKARYTKQFTALDVLLTQLTSTSTSLTQQLATLPSLKTK